MGLARAPRLRRWRGALAGAVTLAALATFTGCAGSPYRATQETWTRSEDSYTALEARAMVRATLETEPFRRAYVDEYARLFALTPEQRAALLAGQLDELRDHWVVIVAFYTSTRSWDDLDPARGFWEVRLEGPHGVWDHPARVKRLNPKNPTWKRLFPYWRTGFSLYELRFDRGGGTGTPLALPGEQLSLVIAGAPARVRLSWTLP